MKCCTGHGYIGKYFSEFTPSKNIDCHCSQPHQTQEHVLWYEHHRCLLWKVYHDISLAEIFRLTEGINALISFLENSGAFTCDGTL
ncbi:hypothetical protein GYMLUDRAFT_170986 [Collybiopsis luxurians FD-317 M1]|uniref:Uncharacterized protein n=1 Tax=Collybiopsis luxurians FD-317 M1 TaxID=944289 RepID=A0A0D0CRZ0_9AGAR|nr:hypothetical protein GYMLUDRAFT_170986 [Collybiopsis luxurians FD-317 M1]